ncbi:hypothetical protein MACJ_001047 [Theileria orientalis]|uniref:Uncharacterized protein n=1 Tax=Theileria orientalis TaxID=68886 RepID=A0A976M7H8_THEOR|nr:hypothetical protein MACJ_001047 [Theileria orientalis]
MIYEPTAWYSYSQFSDIFNRLSDVNEYERILFQIQLWMARGRVPAAIHATSFLLNVIVSDKKSEMPTSHMRDLYAMTIIRTVNLLLDQEQDSLYAKSMLLMGKEANLPENVIKARHRCSHGDIPDLESLRIVCRDAFNYVYKKYWTNQHRIVASKLNDDYNFTFLLFSIFLLSRSGVDMSRSLSYSNKLARVIRGPRIYKFNSENTSEACNETTCVLEHLRKVRSLKNNRKHLSIYRRLNLYGKKHCKYELRTSVRFYIGILRKIMNSCVHEDIFISVFVECVFANYSPGQSQMFLLMLFLVSSQYSFNFTVKLVAHMLNFIFDISDIFTNIHTHEVNSILRRINSCYNVLIHLNKSEQKLVNHTGPDSHGLNSDKYRNSVNEWLLILLQYANCSKTKQFNKYHLDYLRLIKDLSYTEYDRMINYEFTSLSRILVCIKLILPLYIVKLGNSGHSKSVSGWNDDKLSHLICLNRWVNDFGGRYVFSVIDEEAKRKALLESRANYKHNVETLNKNLLPGTLWDDNECRVKYIYPPSETTKFSVHERILDSFGKIARNKLFENDFGDKRVLKVQSQMYNINGSLGSEKEKIRIQKKIFRAISYAICIYRSQI